MCQLTEILNGYPKKHGITIEELAERMGYENHKTLGRHLNHNDHKRPFPASKILLLCEICNDYSAIDHLNARAGRMAVPIPQKAGESDSVNLKSISKLADKSGKALSKMADALSDGIIDEVERKELNAAMIELSQRVNIILGKLNNK